MTDQQLGTGHPASSAPAGRDAQSPAGGSGAAELGSEPTPAVGIPSGDGQPQDPAAEKEIWVGRTHWKHYAGRLILWIMGNTALAIAVSWVASSADWLSAGAAFWVVAGAFVVSGALIVGGVLYKVANHRYRLTSQRLFITHGILSQTVDQTELIRVDDVRMQKSVLDRVLGLGTVTILSTDASNREVIIEGIAGAEKVAEQIRTRMRTMRQKSLFIENL